MKSEAKILGKTQARELTKEITKKYCNVSICYYCGATNGPVLKAPKFYGILHRKFHSKKSDHPQFLSVLITLIY